MQRSARHPSPTSGGAKASLQHGSAGYWETKRLDEMSHDEWERLCDGCGRCCLLKVQDEDTDEIYLTRLGCKLLNVTSCQCDNYVERKVHVPDCITLTIEKLDQLQWLPETCAYRRVHDGRGLAWWHPLVSGSPETVHEAGVSVRGRVVRESAKRLMHVEDFLIADWPAPSDEAERSTSSDPAAM